MNLIASQLASDGLFIQSVGTLGAKRGLELRVLPDARGAKLDAGLSPEAVAARLIVDNLQGQPLSHFERTSTRAYIRRATMDGVFSLGMREELVAAKIKRLLPGVSMVTVKQEWNDGDDIADLVTMDINTAIATEGRLPRLLSLR